MCEYCDIVKEAQRAEYRQQVTSHRPAVQAEVAQEAKSSIEYH